MRKLIFNRLKKDRKIILFSLGAGFLITALISMNYSTRTQKSISDKVIRLHILANSDEEYDQNLKLIVRDKILKKYGDDLTKCETVENSLKYLSENLKDIESLAESVIKENGYNYSASASLGKSVFPTKYYGEISFPPGEYEALKIEIGEAKGQNWWCVVFPPLCFLNVKETPKETPKELPKETLQKSDAPKNSSEAPDKNTIIKVPDSSKEILKNSLTNDEYDLIVSGADELRPQIKIKFKVVEFWQNVKMKTRNFIVTKK
jgi:stage II sporulation protein R